MKEKHFRFILGVLIAVYAFTVFHAMETQAIARKCSERVTRSLSQIRTRDLDSNEAEQEHAEESHRIDIEFESSLLEQNADAAGWITIAGTAVDYPVVQTDNNEMYLHTDFLGGYHSLGTLFFDYECNPAEERARQNLIIYGHMAKYDNMFGSLKYYREPIYYEAHPEVSLYQIGLGARIYEIAGVFVINAYVQEEEEKDYRQIHFETEEEYRQWQAYFIEKSIYQTGVQPDAAKPVLTLSTCAYDFDDARLVIMAIMK